MRGGGGVLMLVLWDWGEGHKKLTAFLKRGILSFRPAFRPSAFVVLHLRLGCLRPGRGPYFGVCGDSKQPTNPEKPTQSPQQANKSPTSAVVLPSLNSLSFGAAVIYSNAISLSSSSSDSPSSSSHHFPSPKLTEPPKAIRSDCLISRRRVCWLK